MFENEIGIGEYVRDRDRYIAKITRIDKDGEVLLYRTDNVGTLYYSDIVEHSRNKIDLINIGDYVNGEMVVDIFEDADSKWLQLSNGKLVRDDDILNFMSGEEFEENMYRFV